MTKKEILEKCCLRKDGSTVYVKKDILNAMEEYAKEEVSNLAAEMLDNTRYEEMWERQIRNQPVGQLTLSQLIERHSINKAHLASKMNMPVGTFKNKLSEKQSAYRFSQEEEGRLKDILRSIAADIEIVAGISFNKALATMINK